MNKNLQDNKGITLIALVITIIVMLILVTVTIRVATNGNLFTHAANAVKGTKNAISNENYILGELAIENIISQQLGEQQTRITNLTNTIWRFNNSITIPANINYSIAGTISSNGQNEYIFTSLTDASSMAGGTSIAFPGTSAPVYAYTYEGNSFSIPSGWYYVVMASNSITPVQAPTITITGGSDVQNSDLIDWLYENATYLETVYTAYSEGDCVYINGNECYVLENSDSNTATVKVFVIDASSASMFDDSSTTYSGSYIEGRVNNFVRNTLGITDLISGTENAGLPSYEEGQWIYNFISDYTILAQFDFWTNQPGVYYVRDDVEPEVFNSIDGLFVYGNSLAESTYQDQNGNYFQGPDYVDNPTSGHGVIPVLTVLKSRLDP